MPRARNAIPILDVKDLARFNRHLRRDSETGCLEWTGFLMPKGYGQMNVGGAKGKGYLVHRIAFVNGGGVLTAERPDVLHSCDNPKCCEYSHLRAGNDAENAGEMSLKCRGRRTATGLPFGAKPAPGGRFKARCTTPGRKSDHLGVHDTWQEASAIAFLHKNLDRYPDLGVN